MTPRAVQVPTILLWLLTVAVWVPISQESLEPLLALHLGGDGQWVSPCRSPSVSPEEGACWITPLFGALGSSVLGCDSLLHPFGWSEFYSCTHTHTLPSVNLVAC